MTASTDRRWARTGVIATLVALSGNGCAALLDLDARRPPLDTVEAGDTSVREASAAPDDAAANPPMDAGDEAADAASPWGVVFISSGTRQADMAAPLDVSAGLQADRWCSQLASTSPGLNGRKWVAWLSGSEASESARRRFPKTRTPIEYRRTDGALVFPRGFPEVPLTPLKPINVDEHGALVSIVTKVWTHTGFDGEVYASAATCSGWRPDGGPDAGSLMGIVGDPYSTEDWTLHLFEKCATQGAIYCFEIR